jgi:biopolymer transport protein TolQ
MLSYFANLSPVIAFVVALLVFFSLVSWTIIVFKLFQTNAARNGSREFLDFFWETRDFAKTQDALERFRGCPIAAVFEEGYRETRHFLGSDSDSGDAPRLGTDIGGIDNIARSLRKVTTSEAYKIEKNLSFLATTGSTTPFIGLFGTVWGIMVAFKNIGETGSTSLDVVAPGISEALITTAIGLAVAIPAVIGFNYLQGRMKVLKDDIDGFSYDFLNIVQKILSAKSR